jgi:hypothetical protein
MHEVRGKIRDAGGEDLKIQILLEEGKKDHLLRSVFFL